jgi:hypothetical protein
MCSADTGSCTPAKDPLRFTKLISELMVAEGESIVGKE